MSRKKIAIIGGGVAGLTAFWQLSKKYDVTLFEKDSYFGGQAQTVAVETPVGVVYADLAVQLFSDQIYPNLFAHFKTYDIKSYISPLSFSAYFPKIKDHWSNTALFSTELGKKLKIECDRFQQEMHFLPNIPREKTASLTLGEFLKEKKFSQNFIQRALKPMFSILAGTRATFIDFSLLYCMVLFNMGLLSFFSPPQWRRLEKGVGLHIDILKNAGAKNGALNCTSKVAHVERGASSVEVVLEKGDKINFDEIVFATSAGVALSLISNPTLHEKKLLGEFEYHEVSSVLHTDPRFLDFIPLKGKDYADLPTCIYSLENEDSLNSEMGTTTFVVNSYTNTRKIPFPILVSIDPKKTIQQKHILATRYFKLPKLRPSDLEIKKNLGSIQGNNNTWFCGLDSSTTGHESSFVSGLVISEALGCEYPYSEFLSAKTCFENNKKVMGMDSTRILATV